MTYFYIYADLKKIKTYGYSIPKYSAIPTTIILFPKNNNMTRKPTLRKCQKTRPLVSHYMITVFETKSSIKNDLPLK